MTSFEDYLVQHKLKNLRYGDKVRYIEKGSYIFKPNEIFTFQKFREVSGELYIKVKEFENILIHPKYITKI